jgi:hypothetical protein
MRQCRFGYVAQVLGGFDVHHDGFSGRTEHVRDTGSGLTVNEQSAVSHQPSLFWEGWRDHREARGASIEGARDESGDRAAKGRIDLHEDSRRRAQLARGGLDG